MSFRTVGLGAFALLVSLAWLQLNCSDNLDLGGTGGIKGQATGGTTATGGSGGQAGTARCLDGPSGQGGHECVAPVVVVVDAQTSGAICDAAFTVKLGDAGTLCDPSEGPMATDGGSSCTYLFDRIINVGDPVTVEVSAPGYQPALFALASGCVFSGSSTVAVPLSPSHNAGVAARRSQ
jgi:hypothetical protein